MRLVPLLVLLSTLATASDGDAPLRDLVERVRDIEAQIGLVERNAIDAPDRAALWAGASRGLVQAGDPHGAYLAPDEVAVHGLGSEPMRFGFGFDWRAGPDGALITRIVPGSPADQAGLAVGWSVLAVDGVRHGEGVRFAEALGRGPDRKHLSLRTLDGSARETELTRAELRDDGLARSVTVGEGIVHLRIGRFMPAATPDEAFTATAAAVRSMLAELKPRAVVLDLRGCSGGNLQAAVEIAGAWLPAGAVVIEQSGRDPARSRSRTSSAMRLPDVPVAVLINGSTASAAEVLAHALHRGRGSPLIGAPSRGKWTVQQLFLLPRGDALQLTVARLRPPGGTNLVGPLQPDIAAVQDETTTHQAWSNTTGVVDTQLTRAIETATALALAR